MIELILTVGFAGLILYSFIYRDRAMIAVLGIAFVGIAVLSALASRSASSDEDRQYSVYCEMTKTWAAEAKAGVPPEDRSGWPPYDGECR